MPLLDSSVLDGLKQISENNMEPVEDHDFYQCIRGLLFVQRLGGGRIQRPRAETGLFRYYTLNIYCILCHVITIGVLIRMMFFFTNDTSVEPDSLYAYLAMAYMITVGVTEVVSFYTYNGILPFWDSLLTAIPRKFDINLFKPRIAIQFLTAYGVCHIMAVYLSTYYLFLQGDIHPSFMRLAEPWTETLTQARLSLAVTFACILPAFISWNSVAPFIMTTGYYLRTGFVELSKAMEDDPQMVTNISTYKNQHLHLCKLTDKLDFILRGTIGTALFHATFDMCFVIFTLSSTEDIVVLVGSIGALYIAVGTLLIIAILSISINSWVSVILYVYLLICHVCIHLFLIAGRNVQAM